MAAALRLVKGASPRPNPNTIPLATTKNEYLLSLRQARRSAGTVSKYDWHLSRLIGWLYDRDCFDLADLNRLLLREWGAEVVEYPHWGPAMARQAVAIAQAFLKWAHEEGLIGRDLTLILRSPPVKRRVQRTLSIAEVQALLRACDPDTCRGTRDLALISLMVDSGLRASEVCRLTCADLRFNLDLDGVQVNLLKIVGKGGDEAIALFGRHTADRLQAWLCMRSAKAGVDEVFIALGGHSTGQALTRFGLNQILERLGDLAGIEHVTPHSLRRSFACIADEAGATTRDIQSWGRWADIRMVERYTMALKASKQYPKFSPVDFLAEGS